ncbi:glycoside hydrolase family 105 protein [Glaciecola sp. SC05]|uniref:glycoside hydrolase family 88/105 protein n=1 Tax=Glaciecola sp. SC05 TaxID=1987355 RepID=UPI0035271C24
MNFKLILLSLVLISTISAAGCNNIVKTGQAAKSEQSDIQRSALDIGERVAQWQIEHLENFDYLEPRYRKGTAEPRNWIQATFYIGLTRWTETVNDSALLRHISEVAESVDYKFRTKRDRHADDHAIGQTYLWLTEQTGDPRTYGFVQQEFDRILANPSNVDLELIEVEPKVWGYEGPCQDRWCWADALFMAPRTWLKLTNITGEDKYFEFADSEFWATADYLFSDEYGLFFRDSRYFESQSDNGKPVFWSRGNGWVFAALPLIIDDLPSDHPSRDRYIALYKKNAAGLQAIQNPNGYWPASLLDPNKVKTPEMSGTAFITFGLAWGVNNGILRDEKYNQSVLKGWQAIEKAIAKNGRVNYVQQVGKSPDPVKKEDTQLYGVGAVLLAASEMTKWAN